MIDALLQKTSPNLLGLFGNAPNANNLFGDISREFAYNMLQNINLPNMNQRVGNQPLGMELLQSDNDVVINPKTFEGKVYFRAWIVLLMRTLAWKSINPRCYCLLYLLQIRKTNEK